MLPNGVLEDKEVSLELDDKYIRKREENARRKPPRETDQCSDLECFMCRNAVPYDMMSGNPI